MEEEDGATQLTETQSKYLHFNMLNITGNYSRKSAIGQVKLEKLKVSNTKLKIWGEKLSELFNSGVNKMKSTYKKNAEIHK